MLYNNEVNWKSNFVSRGKITDDCQLIYGAFLPLHFEAFWVSHRLYRLGIYSKRILSQATESKKIVSCPHKHVDDICKAKSPHQIQQRLENRQL